MSLVELASLEKEVTKEIQDQKELLATVHLAWEN